MKHSETIMRHLASILVCSLVLTSNAVCGAGQETTAPAAKPSTVVSLDGDGWLVEEEFLTEAEKALLDARLASYEKDPDAGGSWEEVEARIRARLKP